MDVGQLFGLVIAAYLVVLAGFAAVTTATALSEDDGDGLSGRIFRSLTKTTVFLGFPGLIATLMFLESQSTGGDTGGIMSKNMGFFVLFLIGALGLLGVWVGSITLGFIAGAVARTMRPMVGAITVFFIVSGAPLLMAGVGAVTSLQQAAARHR